ncbi:MAG: choice-of-anchor J domain-containing protein [Phycisphaerales bacterium]
MFQNRIKAVLASVVAVLSGCSLSTHQTPLSMNPAGMRQGQAPTVRPAGSIPKLINPGDVARGTAKADVLDTRLMVHRRGIEIVGATDLIRNHLPEHVKPGPAPAGPANALVAGSTIDEPRTRLENTFPTISATGWNPPDPTVAVGPNHVVVTVNMAIAFYDKNTGSETFRTNLNNAGGFFGDLGAQGFTFDPKVIYDHYAQRFVMVVLEYYNPDQSWIDIAVSDDSDPNGTWYRYRTDAVIDIGGSTVWWDFPGIGYDQFAYYITGNLFGLNGGPYGGGGFRVFTKAPLLTGGTAAYSTLRDGSLYTCMPATHYGTNNAGYFAYVQNSTTMRIYAIRNPITATPTLTFTSVTTPSYAGSISAPTLNGSAVSNAGMTMPFFRNGRLFVVHNASISGRNVARWHEFNLNNWPVSGSVTRVQSGDIDAGPDRHTVFPAIAVNGAGDVGVSLGVTGANMRVAAAIAGRRAADPAGRMGVPVIVKEGEVNGGGRWGDYFAVGVDPVDDTRFWAVAEYLTPTGWQNWVSNFTVASQSLCHPVGDSAGTFEIGVTSPATIDVLANDWLSTGLTMTIDSFDATSTLGGTITRSAGTGPGGRDRLIYAPPTSGLGGFDSFSYTVRDTAGNTASNSVVMTVTNPSLYRNPENPPVSRAGIQVAWYEVLGAPGALPNFSTLTPYRYDLASQINIANTTGLVGTSTRSDDVGAVFEGFIDVQTASMYTFYLNSDDGSKMFVGDTLVINNDGLHGAVEVASSPLGLKVGKHKVRIEYYEAGGGAQLVASWSSLTLAKAVIPTARWFSVKSCPSNLEAAPNFASRSVALSWRAATGADPLGVIIRRNGEQIASLPASVSAYTDTPPAPAANRHGSFVYTIEATGTAVPFCDNPPRAVSLSGGNVIFAENFDSIADNAALATAGWQSVLSGTVVETEAAWSMDGLRTANPPGVDGRPTSGRYVISDSASATGTNATGAGASLDLLSPTFDCTGRARVTLHFDAVAQLNNNGSTVFDIDVRTASNPTWVNVFRRVAPSRTSPSPAVTISNADGVFGRTSVDLTTRAANQTGVQVRFRHYEPTDDWFIAIDNVLVDDVAAQNGGSSNVLNTQSFTTPIALPWRVVSALSGAQTWTVADPCARSVSNNGGSFPRQSGQAVHRLGGQFAILDSACNPALAHDDLLITPSINCARAFEVWLHVRSEAIVADGTRMEVLLSTDGGATFDPTPVFAYDAASLQDTVEDPFYDNRALHVPGASLRSNVAFAFRVINAGGGMWWGIDDVRVSADLACLSDVNFDRNVDGDDIITFFAAWDAGNADINQDGGTDGDDVIVFFAAWDAGC